MKVYLYKKGIKKLAREVSGRENIHIGIRPFGFHVGNALSTVVYPYMLCLLFRDLGKVPKFNFIISLNDYEQDSLSGPDYHRYPFNIYPRSTIIKYLPDPSGCHKSAADHWVPIIKKSINLIKKDFPDIKITYVKNSDLKNNPYFKNSLLRTLNNPLEQHNIYKKYSNRDVLDHPNHYANPICKKCYSANSDYYIIGEKVTLTCQECGSTFTHKYSQFDYWYYHKPMVVPRYRIFNIDITMGGADHYSEGDVIFRKKFIKLLDKKLKEPKYFFAPLVLARDGKKMSKTLKNEEFPRIDRLLKFSINNPNYSFTATDDLVLKNADEKEYLNHIKSVRLWPSR